MRIIVRKSNPTLALNHDNTEKSSAKRILIIDDTETNRYILGRQLQFAGFEILEAETSSEGIMMARTEAPDLIILDVLLPDMNGFEVCQRLKNRLKTSFIPIIQVSAIFNSPQAKIKGLEKGADAYFTHPIDPDVLIATANSLIRMRKAEREARESAENFRLLTEVMPQLIWSSTPEGRMTYYNRQWSKFLGPFKKGTLELNWKKILHEEDLDFFIGEWHRSLAARKALEIEVRFKKFGRKEFQWMLIRSLPLKDRKGEVLSWFGTCTNIHQQKDNENSLRLLSKMSTMFESSRFVVDDIIRNFFQTVLPTFCNLCLLFFLKEDGTTESFRLRARESKLDQFIQIALQNATLTSRKLTPEILTIFESARVQVFRNITTSSLVGIFLSPFLEIKELLHIHKNNSLMAVPFSSSRRNKGMVVFINDMDQRQYDWKDESFAMELARRLSISLENARLYEEAQTAIKEREKLLMVVSHDLKNPLASMNLNIGLLERGVLPFHTDETIKARHKRAIDSLYKSVQKMKRMIDNILDISKIDQPNRKIEKDTYDLRTSLQDVLDLLASSAEKKNINLNLEMKVANPVISLELSTFERAMINLLENALKFTSPGGNIKVSVEEKEKEGKMLFSVSDTGQGISPEHLPRIFEPFWQAKDTSHLGTGLGLAIVKNIIEAHGGDIWVESTLGKGTIFTFSLPV